MVDRDDHAFRQHGSLRRSGCIGSRRGQGRRRLFRDGKYRRSRQGNQVENRRGNRRGCRQDQNPGRNRPAEKQLESIAQGASFSGENWLLGTGAKTVVSGFVRDGGGTVSVTKTDYTLIDTTAGTTTANVLFGLTGSPATLDTTKGIIGQPGTASGISVWDIDLKLFNSATPPTYTIGNLLTDVETAFQSISSASAALGSIKMRIGLQEDFVSKLTDSIDKGIGRLVDADMNEESTKLKALQTQQQLGIQSLSIANTSSENILSLFRQ
ncbi:Flagellar filament 33 kDa core protein [Agrobacterium tumefaciens]|nr:Flagellar filament 33 kDa core protein [Agrobacterium tumefaciens]